MGQTILLVEKDANTLKSLTNLLENRYTVIAAKDPEKALEKLHSATSPIPLLIAAQDLLPFGGVEFFKRSNAVNPRSFRILLAEEQNSMVRVNSLQEAHIYKFVAKPVQEENLLLAIERALEIYRLEDENRELQRMNLLKSQIFSVISHDFKAPLANVKTLLKMLHNGDLSREEFWELSLELQQKVETTGELVDNILHWSVAHIKNESVVSMQIPLASFVSAALVELTDLTQEKSILTENLVPESSQINFNKDILHILTRNILSNSIKFTPESGKITIFISEDLDYTNIHFQDTGIGMTRETVSRILNHVKSQPREGTRQELGSGVGLILCRELLLKCKGKMQIFSQTNQGTEIIVQIPHISPQIQEPLLNKVHIQ
ncbi:MAG: hybrid sensor histidine kinase/response regulator [Spirochaetota bacterium]